ncbi:hypothetical protein NHQ30_007728 [Ciborinia camelliae]|nr:hypothetical protein NHQ30_007728 [Ciborinia camelliae]
MKAKNPDTFLGDLKSVPSSLEETYKKVYKSLLQEQSLEKVTVIRLVLCFLMYGCYDEIFKASAFLSAINYKRRAKLSAKEVLDLCSTFVELDPETQNFRIIHFSVKEFLQTLTEYDLENANSVIATHCVSYLNDERHYRYYTGRFSRGPWKETYVFRSYGTESWIIHCARAGSLRHKSPLVEKLSEFWPHEGRKEASPFERWVQGMDKLYVKHEYSKSIISGGYGSLVLDSKPTAFFLACQYDLREVVENYLSKGWDINHIVSSQGPGLSYACIGKHKELASYLISRGAKAMFDHLNSSPIFAVIKYQQRETLELCLRHDSMIAVQDVLEIALERGRSWQEGIFLPANDRIVETLLNYSSDFAYSYEVQRLMFEAGPKIFTLLLERNPSLPVTIETLEYLVISSISMSDTQFYLRSLLRLNFELVTTQSFPIFLKYYEGNEHLQLIKYVLEELNPSDSSILISESTLRVAMENSTNQIPFTKFLLQTNPALKISDETILWTIGNFDASTSHVVIETLLQHDPIIRKFHLSDIEEAFDNIDRFRQFVASDSMEILLRYSPEVAIDQELFTQAVRCGPRVRALRTLLSRSPKIKLTPELIDKIYSEGTAQIMGEIICSSPPEQITEEILKVALSSRFLIDAKSSTIVELLSRASNSLELSEETVYHACKCNRHPWIMEKVLERWPNAPLTENAIEAALKDVQLFHILMEKRPSIEIPPGVITSLCRWHNSDISSNLLKVLELQPNTIVTEGMLLAITKFRTLDKSEEGLQLFDTLLRRMPHEYLPDELIFQVIKNGHRATQIMFEARPNLEVSTMILLRVCDKILDREVSQKAWVEVVRRSHNIVLDEDIMMLIITRSSPASLITVLSGRPEAVVTESMIKSLLETITHRSSPSWFRGTKNEEAFDMLLDRSGLQGYPRQLLVSEFQEWRNKMREDYYTSDSS